MQNYCNVHEVTLPTMLSVFVYLQFHEGILVMEDVAIKRGIKSSKCKMKEPKT